MTRTYLSGQLWVSPYRNSFHCKTKLSVFIFPHRDMLLPSSLTISQWEGVCWTVDRWCHHQWTTTSWVDTLPTTTLLWTGALITMATGMFYSRVKETWFDCLTSHLVVTWGSDLAPVRWTLKPLFRNQSVMWPHPMSTMRKNCNQEKMNWFCKTNLLSKRTMCWGNNYATLKKMFGAPKTA